jgi:hypothetical protein
MGTDKVIQQYLSWCNCIVRNFIISTLLRRMQRVRYMVEMRNAYKIVVKNKKGRHHMGNLVLDGSKIRISMRGCGLDSAGSGEGQVACLMNTVMNFWVP